MPPTDSAIKPYVDYFYHVQNENADAGLILPQGSYDLVFNLRSGGTLIKGGRRFHSGRISFTGMHDRATSVCPDGPIDSIGVKLKAEGVYPLLQIPMKYMSNTLLDASDLFSPTALGEVFQRLQEAESDSERAGLIERFLLSQLRTECDSRILRSVKTIRSLNGSVTVHRLAADVNLSERRLAELFLVHVGISAKSYARLVRFGELMRRFRSMPPSERFSRIALDCGYYDQPHFIREFRRIVHKTPRQFSQDRQASDPYNF